MYNMMDSIYKKFSYNSETEEVNMKLQREGFFNSFIIQQMAVLRQRILKSMGMSENESKIKINEFPF